MEPSTDAQRPAAGQNGAPAKGKRQNNRIVRYPIQLRVNVTTAMNDSLARISRRLMIPEGIVGRIALIQYLASNDREYREDR